MFTGIVEGTGAVQGHIQAGQLQLRPSFSVRAIRIGESVSVNGCCLTVTQKRKNLIQADLSPETLKVTNLGKLTPGSHVNLERPVRLSDRLGGHLVSGHVDGIGRILSVKKDSKGSVIEIKIPKNLRRYLIPKGSIAVDGISMTINRLQRDRFDLVVVPHTLRQTNLKDRKRGDWVNLEVDMVGKYIEGLLS